MTVIRLLSYKMQSTGVSFSGRIFACGLNAVRGIENDDVGRDLGIVAHRSHVRYCNVRGTQVLVIIQPGFEGKRNEPCFVSLYLKNDYR